MKRAACVSVRIGLCESKSVTKTISWMQTTMRMEKGKWKKKTNRELKWVIVFILIHESKRKMCKCSSFRIYIGKNWHFSPVCVYLCNIFFFSLLMWNVSRCILIGRICIRRTVYCLEKYFPFIDRHIDRAFVSDHCAAKL